MGGAPPLPHDFAPQGGKNGHFLAILGPPGPPPEDQGSEGGFGGPPACGWGAPGTPRGGLGWPPGARFGKPPGLGEPGGRSNSTDSAGVGRGGNSPDNQPWGGYTEVHPRLGVDITSWSGMMVLSVEPTRMPATTRCRTWHVTEGGRGGEGPRPTEALSSVRTGWIRNRVNANAGWLIIGG